MLEAIPFFALIAIFGASLVRGEAVRRPRGRVASDGLSKDGCGELGHSANDRSRAANFVA